MKKEGFFIIEILATLLILMIAVIGIAKTIEFILYKSHHLQSRYKLIEAIESCGNRIISAPYSDLKLGVHEIKEGKYTFQYEIKQINDEIKMVRLKVKDHGRIENRILYASVYLN